MPATTESKARTRAFARVIGPYVSIVTAIIVMHASSLGTLLPDFFENKSLVWTMGALLLFGGIIIIAFHQYWSSLTAILISLFGWFLALRGVVLLAAPQLIESGATASMNMLPLVQIGFSFLMLIGFWFTYVGWKPTASS